MSRRTAVWRHYDLDVKYQWSPWFQRPRLELELERDDPLSGSRRSGGSRSRAFPSKARLRCKSRIKCHQFYGSEEYEAFFWKKAHHVSSVALGERGNDNNNDRTGRSAEYPRKGCCPTTGRCSLINRHLRRSMTDSYHVMHNSDEVKFDSTGRVTGDWKSHQTRNVPQARTNQGASHTSRVKQRFVRCRRLLGYNTWDETRLALR
ncbi:uncharacterized protein EDB91DRAFT_1335469 [Suillus paluster]|uniref:uncharacterized protein n=1 Tax=Suillus paluster TaxID=48578 RepID=UPI001B85BC83|nr:uncharacterized protein EDB91DRAFT_1335469 [Suillus paluster]KAG1745001.1 hypothetical protein EDB91DRAFT_1335469 [Suillus paluster]